MNDSEKILSVLESLTQKVENLTQDVKRLEQGQDELRQGQQDANRRLSNLELCYSSLQADMLAVKKNQERDSQKFEKLRVALG